LFYAAVVAVLEAVCLSAVSDRTDGHIARSGVG
jgi:phosphatidylserine synthase